MKDSFGIDVSDYAITDQANDLMTDLRRLADAPEVPDSIRVSAMLYEVATGKAQEIAPVQPLADLRR